MNTGLIKFAKNSLANVANSVSGAILALILPYFLVRIFSHLVFSVWILTLQLAAYVNYLNLGLQLAIGRYVAYAIARNDQKMAESVLGAGLQILAALALAGILFIVAVAAAFPLLFHGAGSEAAQIARPALFFIGSAAALALPFNAFSAVFVGHQRNEVPAVVTVASRITLGIAVIVTAALTRDIRPASEVYLLVMLGTFAVQYLVFSRAFGGWNIRAFHRYTSTYRELISYSASLAVWSMAMLLVNGLGALIVALFDFKSVAAFGVALSAATILPAIVQAVSAPLIQIFVRRQAREQSTELLHLLELSALAASLVGISSGLWIAAASRFIFPVWIGATLAVSALPIFYILVAANALRLTGTAYAIYFVSTGQQVYVLLTPLIEGGVNLIASLICVRYFGAMGVGFGVAMGAAVGLLANYVYNLPRTAPGGYRLSRLIRLNLVSPVLWNLPLAGVAVIDTAEQISLEWTVISLLVATIPLCICIWRNFRPMWHTVQPVPTA